MCYKIAENFSPDIGKGKTKEISTKRERPFRTADLPASPLLGHFNWLFDAIRGLLFIMLGL